MRRVVLAALIAAIACGRESPSSRARATSVFIISIDTLRSDRLPVYGHRGASTPAIDAFRKDAILFQHAFSHTPLTLPSHATILTGRIPPGHGVRDNGGYTLDAKLPSIQSILRAKGYATGMAVSSYVLRRETGIAHAFEFFDDALASGEEERRGDETRLALSRWVGENQGRSVFGLLHLFEPHAPYEGSYDAEIARADAVVGRFLDELKGRGLYEPSLIILLSDHGEGLGDHGEEEHGIFLYRESIQVPLLVKLPGNRRAGEAISRAVGLVDVAPTLLDVLEIEHHAPFDGTSLLNDAAERRPIYGETFYPRLHLGWSELFSLLNEEHHYIDAPRTELYRYRSDPAEKTNVVAHERRAAAAMRERLRQIDRTLAAPSPVSAEERESLAALGYVGSASAVGEDLPNPRDRIRFMSLLKQTFAAQRSEDHDRVIDLAASLTKQAPELIDAWALLARSQRSLGRHTDAVATLRAAIARFPERSDVRVELADALVDAGQLASAESEARAVLGNGNVAAVEVLAKIALARREIGQARAHVDRILAKSPDRTSALLISAQIASSERDFFTALSHLERAERQIATRKLRPPRALHSRKAEALLELRRVAEAEREFRTEVTLFPDHLEAWGGLAVVRAARGDLAGAREVLREMTERNPGPRARKLATETLEAIGAR